MPIPRRYTTDAIVLSRFDLGEADRVLTLITPASGKLKAIAKGVRRPTSRLGGSLEPFAELTVGLARGRTFDVVTEVRVGHAWLHLRDSLESAATAWYLAELADRSLEERHAAEPLYALLRRAYELLGHPGPPIGSFLGLSWFIGSLVVLFLVLRRGHRWLTLALKIADAPAASIAPPHEDDDVIRQAPDPGAFRARVAAADARHVTPTDPPSDTPDEP